MHINKCGRKYRNSALSGKLLIVILMLTLIAMYYRDFSDFKFSAKRRQHNKTDNIGAIV